jgi:hypothetical protein
LAKNLKINIKNAQLAQAIDLGSLQGKNAKPKVEGLQEGPVGSGATSEPQPASLEAMSREGKEEAPKLKRALNRLLPNLLRHRKKSGMSSQQLWKRRHRQ